MVGPGEVDNELEIEVKEECQKYGEVNKVIIFEVYVSVCLHAYVYFTCYYDIRIMFYYHDYKYNIDTRQACG